MSRSYRRLPPAQRDAIRHMLLAGLRRRDVAHGLMIDPRRAEIRLRKPRVSEASR